MYPVTNVPEGKSPYIAFLNIIPFSIATWGIIAAVYAFATSMDVGLITLGAVVLGAAFGVFATAVLVIAEYAGALYS